MPTCCVASLSNGSTWPASRPGPQTFTLRQFAAPDVDAVLGTGFFSTHVVCLDPSRGRVAFR